jgi:hypothetical protein
VGRRLAGASAVEPAALARPALLPALSPVPARPSLNALVHEPVNASALPPATALVIAW